MQEFRKVLVYQRPWNSAQFSDLARGIWPCLPSVAVSEHRRYDKSGFFADFYEAVRRNLQNGTSSDLSSAIIDDVILRCRLLRALPKSRALRLVLAADTAVNTTLDRHTPQAMLSVNVDSYILHLFVLACERKNIRFIGLVPSFVNGHFRITSLGERTVCRQVTEEQVNALACDLLRGEYKPDFLVRSPWEMRRKALNSWLRNLFKFPYFAFLRRFSRDPLNYHTLSSEVVARRYWSLWLQDYSGKIVSSKNDIPEELRSRPLVFLPLQMSPEATIDYWSKDELWIDYESRVLELLAIHANRYAFLVKEHPNVVGHRSHGFYERLKTCQGVILIEPSVSSNVLIEISDAVLLATGTVGFEAALRGVPVYSDSLPFHLPPTFSRPIADLDKPLAPRGITADQQLKLLRYVLESVLPGHFVNDGSWNSVKHDQSDIYFSLQLALAVVSNQGPLA